MRVPAHWLASFVDHGLETEALARLLTMQGLEVESVEPVAPPFTGVVAGKVLAVERHPHADRLTVCEVAAGRGTLRVVCGAPNVRAGMLAPLARAGARLPGMEVGAATVRSRFQAGVGSRPACSPARSTPVGLPRPNWPRW